MAKTEQLLARVRSPLAAHARGFHEHLRGLGYSELDSQNASYPELAIMPINHFVRVRCATLKSA